MSLLKDFMVETLHSRPFSTVQVVENGNIPQGLWKFMQLELFRIKNDTRYCVCDEAEPVMLDITSLFFRMISTIRNRKNLAHAKAPLSFVPMWKSWT